MPVTVQGCYTRCLDLPKQEIQKLGRREMRVKNGYIDEGVPMSHPHQSLPSHCSI
uniref:Uncharacterized protein n=1 Tax=Brassica oleracea var. oleracea TaxID=109376 RepID=A0A0D3D2B9_BRAOL